MGDMTTQHDDGDGRHNNDNGKGQQGDMWHDNGNRRQHGNERHDNAAKRG